MEKLTDAHDQGMTAAEALEKIQIDPAAAKVRDRVKELVDRMAQSTDQDAMSEIRRVRGRAVKAAVEELTETINGQLIANGINRANRRKFIAARAKTIAARAEVIIAEAALAFRKQAEGIRASRQTLADV